MFEDETPIAWTKLAEKEPVLAADGTEIGRIHQVLGDRNEDIFHGLAVKLASGGRVVEVPMARIKRMTERHVLTDLSPSEAAALPVYA